MWVSRAADMSGKITGMVWDLALPQNKMLVLLAMADHADHNGQNVRPSMELVAWKTGYSKRQVQRIVTELTDDGLLVPIQREKGKVVNYNIDLSKGRTKPQLDRKKRGRPNQKTCDIQMSQVLEKMVGHSDVTPFSEKPMTLPAKETQKTYDIQMSPEPSVEPSVVVEPSEKTATTTNDVQEAIRLYETELTGTITPMLAQMIESDVQDYGILWIREAVKRAVLRSARRWGYVQGILKRWHDQGHMDGANDKTHVNSESAIPTIPPQKIMRPSPTCPTCKGEGYYDDPTDRKTVVRCNCWHKVVVQGAA